PTDLQARTSRRPLLDASLLRLSFEMRLLHRLALAAAVAALAAGAGILTGIVDAPTGEAIAEFSVLLFAAVVVSADVLATPVSKSAATMPPSFVFTFAVLLRFGGEAAIVTAVASAVTSAIVQWYVTRAFDELIPNSATVIATIAS